MVIENTVFVLMTQMKVLSESLKASKKSTDKIISILEDSSKLLAELSSQIVELKKAAEKES